MEDRSGGSDTDEPMSTTPSPASLDTRATPGRMSVGSSPHHIPSNSPSPGEAAGLQPPPLVAKRPPSTSVSINFLRSLATSRSTPPGVPMVSPPGTPLGVPPGAPLGVPPGAPPGASLGVPTGSRPGASTGPSTSAPPGAALPQQDTSSHTQDLSRSPALCRSVSDPLGTNSPEQEDPSCRSAFSSLPANLSAACIRTPNPVISSDDEDDEVAKIFEADLDRMAVTNQRPSDHVPRKHSCSAQVLDSCSSNSSPGVPEGVMLIRPQNPAPESNPSVAAGLPPDASSGGSDVHCPGAGPSTSDAAVTGASGQVSATSHAGGEGAAIGQQDSSSGYIGVPELSSLQISPKAAKEAFGSGVARSSQRGPKHRPNPYNRPSNMPPLRKSSSRESKSDEEEDL